MSLKDKFAAQVSVLWRLVVHSISVLSCYVALSSHVYRHLPWSYFSTQMETVLVKVPIYGVHLWLPQAHVEAPVSCKSNATYLASGRISWLKWRRYNIYVWRQDIRQSTLKANFIKLTWYIIVNEMVAIGRVINFCHLFQHNLFIAYSLIDWF